MNNFLRAHLRRNPVNPVRLWPCMSIVFTLLMAVSAVMPTRSMAAIGFSGANIIPTASSPGLVCSGGVATFTFVPTTCSLPSGSDWTANYVIDSFDFVGGTYVTPATGTVSGSISAASPNIVYSSPVLTSTSCYTVRYRVRLTLITQACIPSMTAFTSGDADFSVCPQPDPVGGRDAVCVGDTIHLGTTSTGGTWSVTPPGFANIDASGVLTGTSAGVVNVSYTFAGGCASTHTVTVFATPAAITGPTVACQGTTTPYTLASGSTVGTWTSTNTTVGTIDGVTGTYSASPTNTGADTITFTNPGGCSASLIITVNPFPDTIGCNAPMCYGNDTITLCNATAGGTWSASPAGVVDILDASNGIITPASTTAGTATVSYTVAGCSVTVVVTATAAPTAIGGPSSVCEGSTITLTGTPGGGTWSMDTASSLGLIVVNPTTGDVLALMGAGDTTANVVYHLGSCTLTKTITINAVPTPISGGPALCVSQTVTFTSTPAGGFWTMSPPGAYPGGMGSIAVTTGVYTPPGTGTATISYTLPVTGCRATKIVTVGITPDTITGPTLMCQNSSVNLCSATFGGDWGTIPGGTGTATVSPVFASCSDITGTSAGTVIVTYALSASGCSVSKIVTVTPAPTAIAGPDYVCQGSVANYTSSPTPGLWTINPTSLATIGPATGVVTGNTSGLTGNATITYTLPNGCFTTRVVTVSTTPGPITGILSICVGQATALSSSPVGGTWMGTDTSVATVDTFTGFVNGVSPGAIIVTHTLQPSGCYTQAVVTVNPLPPAITGPTGACQGEHVTLSNSSPGGTWGSSLTSIATVNPTTGDVTAISPGTTTISYTTPSAGCVRTMVFTVHPLPLDILGTLSVCVGGTTALSNTSPGGPGTWSSSNPSVADVGSASGLVTGYTAGTANITYVLPTGCDTFATVTVNPLPATISGTPRTCIGSCTTLSNTSTGGTWSVFDPAVATIHPSLGTLCGVSVGTTRVTYTLPTGCITVTIATVDPTPPLPVGNQSICVGSSTTYTHAIPGGTWSSSDTNVAKVFLGTGLVVGMSVGVADITYTTIFGCSTSISITVNAVPPANTGTLYMCVNNSTTLSNPFPGGKWYTQNSAIASVDSVTGVVTGIDAGTTHITYRMPSGCAATSVVTVYPLPVISGSVLVCPGVASTLTASPTGGLWTSSPTSVATIGSLSGVVMGVNAGTVNVTYILASTCQAHITATVQPLPAVITGPTEVCQGSTIQLFNFTGGGGTWSSANPAIATINTTTGVVTGVSPGTATITFTANTTGCVISTVITVNPLPGPITGPSVVCAASSVTLSSTPAGGTWSTTGHYTTIGTGTGVVTGTSAGVDTVTYTLPTGCIRTSTVTVNPLPTPIAGDTAVCHGNTITIFSGPAGGTWSTTSSIITLTPLAAGSDTATVVGLTPGSAIVTYTLPTGCSDTGIVIVNPLPGPIAGAMNLCVHDSTTLTNPTPGGTWSSENVYIATFVPGTGRLGTVSAGTVTVTYTLPTGCFITGVVTINPTPQPITGTLNVCVGLTTTLGNVTTGGSWSSSNGAVATIGSADGVVTGITQGTSVITYSLPSSCYITAVVTVNPNPTPIVGPLAICRFDTTLPVLSSTPAGGTWSSSNPSVAFIFMPTGQLIGINAGTSIITYTLPTGCIRTAIATINPVPRASDIIGPRVVCLGQSATLVHSVLPGGTWISSNTLAVTISPTTGTYIGVGVGTSNITYTTPQGCDTFITVTVNPLPTPITGVPSVCVGSTTTLSSTPAGGTWTSVSPAVGTIDGATGVFTGITPGVTQVIYTNSVTGCQISINVTVNPLPAPFIFLHSTGVLCEGQIDTILTPTTGGSWDVVPASGVITLTPYGAGNSAQIVAIAADTALVTYTTAAGCKRSVEVIVHPLPTPITGPDTLCLGSDIILSSYSPSGTVGTWTAAPSGIVTITPISAAQDTVTVHGDAVGTTYITYTNDFNCSVRDSVTVRPLPGVIGGPGSVCVGSTITMTNDTAGGSWSISDTTVITTIATIDPVTGVVTGVLEGTATVTYTMPTGCFVIRDITVNPLPDVSIVSFPDIICKYSNTTLTATGAGTGGTYSWSPGTGLNTTTGPVVVAGPTVTTTYTVTGTTAAGCSDTAWVTVWVDSLLNDITITGQDTICKGDCTVLIANGRESTYFEWRPSTGLSCTICDTVTACPVNTITYNALAIDSLGCRDSLDFTVHVMPLPQLSVSPNPVIVCNGSSTQMTVNDQFSTPGYQTRYGWFPNAFLSCDTCSNPSTSTTFNLVYKVTGITPFGCIDSIHVPVTVLDSAFNSINKDTVICPEGSAQLYAISINPDGARSDFLWSSNVPSNMRTISNPVVSPAVTTTYSVVITPNVCWPDTLYTTVVVAPAPEVRVTATPGGAVAPGTLVTLDAVISNGLVLSTYAWSDPSLVSCVECFKTTTTPTVTTTYTFTATSVYGCENSATVTIVVGCENSQVYIANSFTPNGDGMNDRFYVQGKGISRVDKFLIFGRWGELVYERYNIDANDPSTGWDGQYKDVMLPPGVYYYVVEATCNLGQVFTYKGDVTIVK